MEKPPFQFRLRTIFGATAIAAIWLAGMSAVRNFPYFFRHAAHICMTLAFLGAGFWVYAARFEIGHDWRRGVSQLGFVIIGMGLFVAAGFTAFVAFAAYFYEHAG